MVLYGKQGPQVNIFGNIVLSTVFPGIFYIFTKVKFIRTKRDVYINKFVISTIKIENKLLNLLAKAILIYSMRL